MTYSLKDKIAIITGGAQAIGKATAEKFSSAGARVIIWDLDKEKGEAFLKDIKEQKYMIEFSEVDITKLDKVVKAANSIFNEFNRIDILINIASVAGDATLLNFNQEQWQKGIDLNLTGVFNCTKAIAPYMVKNQFGRIINTSSLVSAFGNVGQSDIEATKSGIVSITKVWARELSKHGITVNAVTPGLIETHGFDMIPERTVKSIQEKIPVGRLGRPEDIANAYLFLASNESSYISGSVLTVDGGYVA